MITDDEVRVNIAANLSRILKNRGWSQRELCRKCGEKPMVVNAAINGRHIPRASTLARIAEALDVCMDRLVAPCGK